MKSITKFFIHYRFSRQFCTITSIASDCSAETFWTKAIQRTFIQYNAIELFKGWEYYKWMDREGNKLKRMPNEVRLNKQ